MPPSKSTSSTTASSSSFSTRTPSQQQQQPPPPSSRTTPRPHPPSSSSPLSTLIASYRTTTPSRLKFVDAFLVFLILSGVLQFLYCVLVTDFPFNSFVAGFASTVGQFVLAASLRIQANPENATTFPKVSPERAFGDFLFGSVVLHFFVFNFLG